MMTRKLEDERDAAYKVASAAYDREGAAAEAALYKNRDEAESVRLAAHTAINRRCLDKDDWTRPADRAARVQVDDQHKARLREIDDAYESLCTAIRARYETACEAADERYSRELDEHDAAVDRKRESKERAKLEAAERERKRVARQRVADKFDIARQVAEATTPPLVTVTPAQAAARVGMTIGQLWACVRSGKYPTPNDDNLYDADTVARLPRPKVVRKPVQRATPQNVLTDILKF